MVTQEQIARKLGISRQLVTLALAGYPQVSKRSRQRILGAAVKMGYRPNPFARALKMGKTGIIALWIPNQISTHYAHVARELNRLVKLGRHELIVSEVGSIKAEQVLSHVPVDGIIVVDAPDQARAYLHSLSSNSVPVISMGADCWEKTDFVRVDLLAGTMDAMKHLINAGFKRIVHATFMRKNGPLAARRSGYVASMRQAGLKPQFFYYDAVDDQRSIVRGLIQEYIREEGRPEAFFCHSDDVALGIYRGLVDMGFRVPGDIALVGCDGIQDTEYLECPITTIVQPITAMCETAWTFLEQRLARPEIDRQQKVLKPKLQVRQSSARPAHAAPAV